MGKTFATAINCIDGRAQEPVTEYMRKTFNVDYVDMITEPGPSKVFAEGNNTNIINSLKEKIKISIDNHNSQIIVITAHYDCTANLADENVQKEQLREAVGIITSWGLPVKSITALWLNENFEPSIVSQILSWNN